MGGRGSASKITAAPIAQQLPAADTQAAIVDLTPSTRGTKTTDTYIWTTPRGAKVEAVITVEHITSELRSLDGFEEYYKKVNRWSRTVERMTVDGQPTKMKELSYYDAQPVIVVDEIKRGRVRDTVMVAIPANVEKALFGEERAYQARKDAYNEKLEAEYQRYTQAVLKMLDDDAYPYR